MHKIDFSRQDLIEIVERASTITERFSAAFVLDKAQENDAIVNSRIEQWCQMVAEGNWEKFEQRLAWDGLDLSTVRSALGSVRMSDEQQLPAWAETLNESMKASKAVGLKNLAKGNLGQTHFLAPKWPLPIVPFEEVLFPFIYIARQKLIAQAGSCYHLLSEEAHYILERSLLQWLSSLCSRAMELEFSVFRTSKQSTVMRLLGRYAGDCSKEQYRDFIKGLLGGGLIAFFREYPVLARLVSMGTDLWVESSGEFLCRLASDWSEIQKTFHAETKLGQVVAVQPNLSDRHYCGRSVMAVKFASGLRLVYKPKNLGIEQAYFKLLAWLNQHGFPLPFKLIKVINRSTYGWVEFVDALSCKDKEEAKRYYQRAGALLCLTYVLEATDLHIENIVACGEHPVLIDLETLMHPRRQEFEDPGAAKGAQSEANRQFEHSVLRTGLLPRWQFEMAKQTYDVTGLGGGGQQETLFRGPKWKNINTDTMARVYEYVKTQPRSNVPSLDGINLSLNDYHEEIVAGFRQMYRFLVAHRKALLAPDGPLTNLADQQVRFVFRPTKTYISVLQRALNPKFLRDSADWCIQLDLLSRVVFLSDSKPLFWSLLKLERQALEQLDVPLFSAYANSDALTVSRNQTIAQYFTEPSFNLVVSRLSQLSDEDLEQQIGFIRGSLCARTAREAHRSSLSENVDTELGAVVPLTREEIVQQAIAIATNLQKQAICSADGSATWIAPQYILKAQRFQLQPMGYGLYDGMCGVALFLAALEKVTAGARFQHLALAALQTLRQELQGSASAQIVEIGIGGASGCGSIIYGLVRVSQFLEEPSLLEDAKQVATLISPDLITADQTFDIISGAAGAILGLLALHNISADSEVLEQAITCGNHLLNHRVASESGYRGWATLDGRLLTGFSHGAAGIAYALLRLYQVAGEITFLEAAQEANAYERSVFIAKEGNWPDFRESSNKERPTCMCSWCHGAPGIGLARVAGLDILDTPEIRQDIEAAINTTKQHKFSGIDYLCCGNLGRVELLFTAARKLSQPELLEIAITHAAQVVARAEQKGTFSYNPSLSYTPGFFHGAAGIGYELLRLAHPDLLPSVLLWE